MESKGGSKQPQAQETRKSGTLCSRILALKGLQNCQIPSSPSLTPARFPAALATDSKYHILSRQSVLDRADCQKAPAQSEPTSVLLSLQRPDPSTIFLPQNNPSVLGVMIYHLAWVSGEELRPRMLVGLKGFCSHPCVRFLSNQVHIKTTGAWGWRTIVLNNPLHNCPLAFINSPFPKLFSF